MLTLFVKSLKNKAGIQTSWILSTRYLNSRTDLVTGVCVCLYVSLNNRVSELIRSFQKKMAVPVLGAEDSGEYKAKSMSAMELMFRW